MMTDFETEKNNQFSNFLKIQNELNPKLFDNAQKLHPEVRSALLKIAEFMSTYLDNVFVNLKVEDVLLSGSMGGYTYSEDSDIDLMVMIKPDENLISIEEFDRQFSFLNTGLSGRGYKFTIRGYNVDYKWHTDMPPSSGVYSVKDDKWLSKPLKQNYNFTKEEFVQKITAYDEKVQSFIRSLPRNNDNFLTMEACDEAEKFYLELRKENDRVITTSPEKEYDIDYAVYRCFRRYKKHTGLMKFVSDSYANNLSR